eukprot:CAMPEP_0178448148 /NCGR_PEP_ID=MMETSP0689_2-20121128/41814_1 /TAXON_ID=160604 /ORGANISM="Amphidinium massartii, Strain CS-259" /LENGTH=112 /DNA_ID=CAMNT_0020073283 /DNA_START=261 /DNA_END=595 /DNA_ORIENTATION=-
MEHALASSFCMHCDCANPGLRWRGAASHALGARRKAVESNTTWSLSTSSQPVVASDSSFLQHGEAAPICPGVGTATEPYATRQALAQPLRQLHGKYSMVEAARGRAAIPALS